MRGSGWGIAALAATGILSSGAAAAQDQSLSGAGRDARLAELTAEAWMGRTASLPVNAAALDAALSQGDYASLRRQMGAGSAAEAGLMLNWSKLAVFKGAPFPVSLIYAGDLWRMGEAMERAAAREPANVADLGARARSMKTMSLLMALHAGMVLQVDGVRCVDPEAATGPLGEMHEAMAPQWAFAQTLPVEERARLIRTAAALEAKTAPVRLPDYRLCATEMAETGAMAAGTPRAGVDPATPGGDVEVLIDPDDLVVESGAWWAGMPLVRMVALTTAARHLGVPFERVM